MLLAGGPTIVRAVGLEIPAPNKKRMGVPFKCYDEVRYCPLLTLLAFMFDPTAKAFSAA
jgi:hypothetical protein